MRTLLPPLLATLALYPALAAAEGTTETTVSQKLGASTKIHVDLLRAGETFTWQGEVTDETFTQVPISADVYDDLGNFISTVPDGGVFAPGVAGTFEVDPNSIDTAADLDSDPDDISFWDINVPGRAAGYGRVWSTKWNFEAQTFADSSSFNGSVYTLVDGGSPTNDGVVELLANGLAGRSYKLIANSQGTVAFPGRSVDSLDNAALEEFAIYLNPPEKAQYNTLTPSISNATFQTGVCAGVAPGFSTGTITFDSNVEGVLHFVCDADGDGLFDFTNDGDVHFQYDAVLGQNQIEWDGTFDTGEHLDPGVYTCQVILTVGEFHYAALDVETSYEGFRLFEVDAALNRTGLLMYWNDQLVTYKDVLMPDGLQSLVYTTLTGVPSGRYTDATIPNVNARSWGNFTDAGRGNDSFLDTYTWIADDRAQFDIEVLDTQLDTDGDALPDELEDCLYNTDKFDPDTDGDGLDDGQEILDLGSNALDPDTDGDGIDDGTETPAPNFPKDTDGDGIYNLNDTDDDGDGIPSVDEVPYGDTDGDGTEDYLDTNDDNDGIPTLDEGGDLSIDSDGDGTPDVHDTDDDNDTVLSKDESTDDFDNDGLPDYIDPDDDGDNVPTSIEAGLSDPDWDGDFAMNWLDPDDDGDGVPTIEEDHDGDGHPENDDTDAAYYSYGPNTADGLPDYIDYDDDGDGVLTKEEEFQTLDGKPANEDWDCDGIPNYIDWDDDGDGVPTYAEDVNGDFDRFDDDSDNDGIPDFLDFDDDNDGIPTLIEGFSNIDGDQWDPDNDGVLNGGPGNWLDTDSDGDGVLDVDEAGYYQVFYNTGDGSCSYINSSIDLDTDGDGVVDSDDPDDDGDGIATVDEDLDGDGDPRNDDFDADGKPDFLDSDDDGDHIDTKTEGSDDLDGDSTPNYLDLDSDGDSYSDDDEGAVDTDGDGKLDFLDTDDDGDSVDSIDEFTGDTDGDGTADRIDDDDDGDGIPTAQEKSDGLALSTDNLDGTDVDGDGTPNWLDDDSDGDTKLDADEGTDDVDSDTIPNYLDPVDAVPTAGWYQGGVSCSTTGSAAPWWTVGLLGVALIRRRRGGKA